MDKVTFMRDLESALSGEVSDYVKQDTLQYYDRYISEELAKGKSEDAIFASLGTGNMIAKTVIEAERAKAPDYEENYNQKGQARYEQSSGGNYQSRAGGYQSSHDGVRGEDNQKGLHIGFDKQGNPRVKYGKFQFNSWYGKLLGILLLILVIVLIGFIISGVVSLLVYLLPVIIFLVLVWFVIQIIRKS